MRKDGEERIESKETRTVMEGWCRMEGRCRRYLVRNRSGRQTTL